MHLNKLTLLFLTFWNFNQSQTRLPTSLNSYKSITKVKP